MAKRKQHTTENFIERLKLLFVDKYTYKNTVYKNYKTKVKIFCIKHQKDFEISPSKNIGRRSMPIMRTWTKN